jgi:N-acetylmuramoyl-L-alanine amidase
MPSFGRGLAAALLLAAMVPALHAQSSQAKVLYTEARARETALRRDLDAHRPDEPAELLIRRVRVLAGTYEDMARLFPASGYGDRSLWQGGSLCADAFWQFGEPEDRATALRLFAALRSRFPASALLRQVPAQAKRLEGAKPSLEGTKASTAVASTRRAQAAPAGPAAPAGSALTAIRREVLPDALRITLELDREVPFRDERLDAPPRVFIDLQNTRAVGALKDAIMPFADDLVTQVRVGRQLNARTRVVLDLKAAGRYGVYALYNPYRVIIDFERPKEATETSDPSATKDATATIAVAIPSHAPGASWPPGPLAATGEGKAASAPDAAIAPKAAAVNSSGGFSLSRQLGLGVTRIVIDAGHGGRDPGAKAKGLTEAEIVLDIALRLEKVLLRERGVEVLLTRRTNAFIPLEERTAIANRWGADLFLSIHANASPDTAARGIETYFLNFAPNPEAEAIAARENAGSAKSMRHLPDIVKAIALNNKIDESRDFATFVQTSLHGGLRKSNKNLKNLGVKQAPFMVLIGATMPSVLAEISFMTNGAEATLLKTGAYRQQIAESLLDGVMRYQRSLKRVPEIAAQ